jgi:polysaccharide deacetylase 2 family uncharacterized protein YibQ
MKALTVTASIVLSALLLCIAWLAFFPGDSGDPSVTVAVSPPPPKPPAPPPQPPRATSPPTIDLPPGFGISPRPQKNQGEAPGAAQQQAGTQAPGQPTQVQTVAVRPPPALPPPESETASITLVDVPVAELVEESQYGPLPKVATDGRRPIDIYARPSAFTEKKPGQPPHIAVLINGMGLSDDATAEAIKSLPAPVSVAYGAYGRNIQDWVDRARDAGHEVLLQVPLEPLDYPTNDPGPHTLLTTLPPEENLKRLLWLMSRFTGYVGLTNLTGAKFQQAQASFAPVLEEVKARGLLFVDDGSVKDSAGGQIAGAIGLDYAAADVQIDAVPSPDDISKALARLEAVALEKGSAIGVASAKPATIKQLAQWAGQLQGKNIVLVPISAAVRSQRQG